MKLNSRNKKLLAGLAVGIVAGVVLWRKRKTLVTPLDKKRALPAPDPKDMGEPGRNTEKRLDAAIEESFPASDPVSIHIE